MPDEATNARTRLRMKPDRGHYDRTTIDAILDEALVAHVGFDDGHGPAVIPTAFARDGERILIHGSTKSRMLQRLGTGAPCSVAVTLIDGLVLARAAFHNSINYRSVVVYGIAEPVDEPAAKREALRLITEKLAPGRWAESRPPTDQELKASAVLELPLTEASAFAAGRPWTSYDLPFWAGVVPLRLVAGPPQADPALAADIRPPAHVEGLAAQGP